MITLRPFSFAEDEGYIAGLDHDPRVVPAEHASTRADWLRGYDEGAAVMAKAEAALATVGL